MQLPGFLTAFFFFLGLGCGGSSSHVSSDALASTPASSQMLCNK